VKWLIMETHEEYAGEEAISAMTLRLQSLGFEIRERAQGNVLALLNRRLSN
jgi:hypothetical protein